MNSPLQRSAVDWLDVKCSGIRDVVLSLIIDPDEIKRQRIVAVLRHFNAWIDQNPDALKALALSADPKVQLTRLALAWHLGGDWDSVVAAAEPLRPQYEAWTRALSIARTPREQRTRSQQKTLDTWVRDNPVDAVCMFGS